MKKNYSYATPSLLHIVCACLVTVLGLVLPSARAADAGGVCTHMIASGNPEYPPYLWRDPNDATRLIGANADFMQLIAKELGITIEIKYVGSWARVQEETKLGHEDLIAGAFFTLPRLDYMDYVYPAFRETSSVIWTKDSANLKYKKWSDLRGLLAKAVYKLSRERVMDGLVRKNIDLWRVQTQ